MRIGRAALAGAAATLLIAALLAPAAAQSSREAERKLQTIKRELKSVAAERRKLEDQRGAASRQLRQADEQVGQSNRSLRDTEQRLSRDQAALAQLQQRRAALQGTLAGRRAELERLLRAAYTQGRAAPLKVMLAQDRVADSQRLLSYHRYLQRDRAQRIATLSAELRELDTVEREIVSRRAQLADVRAQARSQLDQLERERQQRATLVAQIDQRYQDRSAREQALGRDAKGLEQLLRKLRAAAARAEAQRKADAAREARAERAAAKAGTRPAARKPAVVASAGPALRVGGLGWPLSGALIAGYGATMPDGRNSDGLLIGAGAGTSVKAVAEGTVVYAEWMTGYGLLLIVDHGNGYMSLYAHNDALLKDAGDRVRQGDAVATVGSSGGHGRPALYFELRRNGAPVNPGTWLRR
ncbi:murein hydrolase activator EnvC family protein [Lysobacter koreensis]|uniref:Murein hydrolase activator EnvC family protein n=1 Tax=Lysobacter koreensis TaxID=266122 RepID=A0ABW2YQ04_9GAMM